MGLRLGIGMVDGIGTGDWVRVLGWGIENGGWDWDFVLGIGIEN